MQQEQEYPKKTDIAPYLASNCVGYHKEYPKSLYKQVFEPDIIMKPNYKAIKIFDPQELVRHLQKHFPLIRKNIRQFDDQMKKLNQTFGHMIVNGFHIDDFLKKFFFVLDKRLHKFFDHLDQHVFKLDGKQVQVLIPGDYRIGDTRQHIRQKLIDMSNDLVTKFASRKTPQEYDREVIKKIDQILRVYELLKYDQGWHFIINITKFNLEDLLERVCNNELTQFQKIDELIESMFLISMKQIKDATEHENTSPLFVFNKDVVLSKFHQIINDRSDPQMSTDDLYYVSKTVCMRDRRIIYNEFYNQINKELKEIAPEYFQFATTEKSEYQKKREELHKKLLKTQNEWESLKEDENYYLIQEDRINEEDLRKVPLTSEQQLQQLQKLNAFANKASNLQYDAVTLFKDILDHKDESKVQIETKLQEALEKAKQFYTKMTPGRTPSSNQIKQHVDSLYSELTNLLNSDISKFQGQMSQTDKSVEQQLSRNKQNPYLQQVQKELQRQQHVRDHMQKEQENEMKRRSELVNAQADLMIRQQQQRELFKENQSTRPTQPVNTGKIMEGSSITNELYYEKVVANYQKPELEGGKYETIINKNKAQKLHSLDRGVYVGSTPQHYVDEVMGQPLDPIKLREDNERRYNQQKKPDPGQQARKDPPRKPEPPRQEPPKKTDPPPKEVQKQEPPKKPDPPPKEIQKPEPPKKSEPPPKEIQKPEPPKKSEPPPKEIQKQEPPKKPDPPPKEIQKPEPPKKPEPKQDPPKKPDPPHKEIQKPEPPKKPEPKQDPPKKPDPPQKEIQKPEPPKKPEPKQDPPKKPEPPQKEIQKPEPPKKPEPPQKEIQKPEPPKKPEPPQKEIQKPEPPKKSEPPQKEIQKPEPPKKPEPPQKEIQKPEPPKKSEPPPKEIQKPEPPKKPEPPLKDVQKSEPPKKTDPPQKKPEPHPEPQKIMPNNQKMIDPYAIDFPDDDDPYDGFDNEPITKGQQFIQQPLQRGLNQYEQPLKKPGSDINFNSEDEKENPEDMLGIQQLGDEGEEIDQILITPEILPQINKYTKGTKYGKNMPITMQEFNSFEYVIQLFEDFIIQDEAYFLDFDETAQILFIFEKFISQEEDIQDDIEKLEQYLQGKFLEKTGRPNFGEQKNFFPFEDNPFSFYLVEKDPLSKQLILYYDEQPNEDQMGEEFGQFLGMFQQLFSCEEFEISQVILPIQSKNKLDSFGADGRYIKYMMTVFTLIYEQQTLQTEIIINDDTIARAFWALHQSTELYTLLQDNEEDVRATFFEMLEQAQKNDKTVLIATIEELYSKEGLENLQNQVQEIYDNFTQNKIIKQAFFSIDIVIQEQQQKCCMYVHLQKVSQLNFLKIFTLQSYGEFNQQMLNFLLVDDGLFTQKVFIDFPRHNLFQEYSEVTLGAFYHLVVKKNLKPEEAMANLVFSLVPYNLILRKQE
ncbi:unnamed protein product (macronuclear) [Paramecium tetraurelia]|uniref:Uncharacterized protein n=1 Tax=Paramecium tetraurelia TaxID=5888 RepID=A0DE74_PARTE|nr:uncharacterized protein GSPATT00016183001 [Paramecium tetraurelia]CAK81341.1 unnamed protein product [Paramecium tetraurelia]|eukprot:XP_001448738.1 hypothetical protein (macronuclear) [Paramecium tetraurelia strain d4-2]